MSELDDLQAQIVAAKRKRAEAIQAASDALVAERQRDAVAVAKAQLAEIEADTATYSPVTGRPRPAPVVAPSKVDDDEGDDV